MTDTEQPLVAMGLVNAAVSHRDHRPRDPQAIESIALERDYVLIDILTVTPATYMPTSVIAFEALTRSAVAVVAPSIAHFGGHAAMELHLAVEFPNGPVLDFRAEKSIAERFAAEMERHGSAVVTVDSAVSNTMRHLPYQRLFTS